MTTINELVTRITELNPEFKFSKKAHKKADLETILVELNKAQGVEIVEPTVSLEDAKHPRAGSKVETIMKLMLQPGGASVQDIMQVSGWAKSGAAGFIGCDVKARYGFGVKKTGKHGSHRYELLTPEGYEL